MIDLWSTYCDEGYYCAVYSKCCARGCCIFTRNGVTVNQAGVGIIFIIICVAILACLCVSARPVQFTPWFTRSSTPPPSTQSITQSFLNLFMCPPPYTEVVPRDDEEAPPPYSEVCENPDRYPPCFNTEPSDVVVQTHKPTAKTLNNFRTKSRSFIAKLDSNDNTISEMLLPSGNTNGNPSYEMGHQPYKIKSSKSFN